MGLEDFEKELAQSKTAHPSHDHDSRGHDGRGDGTERRHRHHHRSRRHRDDDGDGKRRERHKRPRDQDDVGEGRHRSEKYRSRSAGKQSLPKDHKVSDSDDEGDEWVEKEAVAAPPEENILDQRDQDLKETKVQRDAWMQEPSALDIEYVQAKKSNVPKSQFVGAKDNNEFKVHESRVNSHVAELQRDLESDDEGADIQSELQDKPAQHEVSYTFGDSGSQWRMTKLNAVYRQANETGREVEEIALDRFSDLREFDEAREEERELDRRKMYGKEYVGLEKPSGVLFQERKMAAGVRSDADEQKDSHPALPQEQPMGETLSSPTNPPLSISALNKLKAEMMKAKIRKAPNAAQLEADYNAAASEALGNQASSDTVVLNQMHSRQLAGDRSGEVTAVSGKRGRERGLVEENEDMSIEDMVRNEKRTRGVNGGEGRAFAERIAKDGRFKNDLDYMDDNATNLSKKVVKSDMNLRNTAIGDFQKMQRILDTCPLCYREDSDQPPVAPVVSLATRTYLTLATEPEIAKLGTVIVPLQHRLNLLECDDDEWEEIRNFMKSLTRFYHALDKGVIFYENAAHMSSRKGHAALFAIPLPYHLADTAPAYFKEAILASDEQWSQHRPIIDTIALSQKPGYGKQAFRKSMVKEMPYFHVWFGMDGGMGHVIEDERRWPKGDLFAREIIGGMLDRGPDVIKKQGRWERSDKRVEGFRAKWTKFDWTTCFNT
nr:pre-mrna-splicing factor cwf19 [Quercus suber]